MEDIKDIIADILKKLSLFSELNAAAIKELAGLAEERIFHKGETIFEESTTGRSILGIVSGEVRITQMAKVSGEETLTVLKKGDFFGEMALLEDLPRSATAIAHSDTFMLEISREKFLRFIEKDPVSGVKILFTLAKILSERLREADIKIKAFVNLSQWI
ncbi:MAG: cyclic nucleotide-binding domain-containing protein [Candidatus Aminicenantes bacterium]|nr:cyclic nucleotide-binding domain-containing protein [Candidatus Aminicenantes bacterium]